MKDPIVQEIHRNRANYAKRFSYDVEAIGADIRQSEAKSEGKFAASVSRRKRIVKRRSSTKTRGIVSR